MTNLKQDECGEYWEAVAGDDLAIELQLLDAQGNPEKLGAGDGVTEIVGEFLAADGTSVQVKLTLDTVTLVDETCGRISLDPVAAVSATLRADKVKKQTFSVYRLKSGKKRTWLFENQLLLKPRPVPAA